MHVQGCIHIYAKHMWKSNSGVIQALSTLFYSFEIRVLIGLELRSRVRWLANTPRGQACLCFPGAGVTSTHAVPSFLLFSRGFWESNSGPHILQTKLFPQPSDHILAKALVS